jgi:O-antigen ligase
LATDNDYLRTLGESGILGFVTFAAIMLFFVIKTIPNLFNKKADILPLIFFGAMLTFLVNATLIDVFEASKVAYLFWIMMGLYYQSLQLKS